MVNPLGDVIGIHLYQLQNDVRSAWKKEHTRDDTEVLLYQHAVSLPIIAERLGVLICLKISELQL